MDATERVRDAERPPTAPAGDDRLAAGMFIMAGGGTGTPPDYDELERWTRIGYERG